MIVPSSHPSITSEHSSYSGTDTPGTLSSSSSAITLFTPDTNISSPLLRLPPELLTHLRAHLPYPDLLSLRHTHPYFYHTPLLATDRNILIKVSWLLDRKDRGLPCPQSHKTIFKTDREFCGSREVKRILVRRRRHRECAPTEGGCEVVTGETCVGGGWKYVLWREIRDVQQWEEGLWSVVVVVAAVILWYMGLQAGFGSLARIVRSVLRS